MWLRDVDIPDDVIRAHREGDLVVFVGAGASVDPPSSLPTFVRLTETIAAASGRNLLEADRARPDRVLGELGQEGVDVHARVADLLQPSGSAPNALHDALADLVVAGLTVRVVTTNYDLHLTSETAARGATSRYTAPALPVGDDFTGVVHLHGALDHPPSTLVVTDRDFGRAYLTDAWAARFLERMFGRFVVLFVGYSHEDVVMTYLARGLGPASRRFAFTSQPGSAEWRRLGIEPIGYPLGDGDDHRALGASIKAWAKRASMGLLDHRAHVSSLVSGSPSEIPDDVSYLESVLQDQQAVRFFTEFADGNAWLTWAGTQQSFRVLFDPATPSTPVTQALAHWFVEKFVLVEDLSDNALNVLAAHGGRMSAELWHSIGGNIHAGPNPRPAWLNRWLTMLLRDPPEHTDDWLEYALVASRWPEDRSIALTLFDHLTEPHPSLRGTFGPLSVRTSIEVGGSEHWLRKAWQDILRPHLDEIAEDVVSIGDHHLRRARQLLLAADVAGDEWDPISYRRRGIEPNPQDDFSDPIDVVIDATRDAIVHLSHHEPASAEGWVHRWENASVPLLRRLATHVWAVRPDKTSDEKLAWLRSRNLLYTVQQHHDVYQLLTTVDGASDNEMARVLEVVLAGPPDIREYRDHAVINLLAWLAQHAPGNEDVQAAFAQFQAEHPEVAPRTHLDYLSWSESGSIGHQPPMTPEELHHRLETDGTDAVAELIGYRGRTSPFDGPTWNDVTDLLATVVRQWPEDGFRIFSLAAGHPEQEHEIVRAAIEGWSDADLAINVAGDIVDHLLQRADLESLRDVVARMLGERLASQPNPSPWPTMGTARELATRLWAASGVEPPDEPADDPEHVLSHWGSNLAEFWIQVVAADWRADQDNWTGFTSAVREPLNRIIETTGAAGVAGRSTLVTRLHFFFSADQRWTTERLLPLLRWTTEGARGAWAAFIAWGRWSIPLLRGGLLELYLEAARHRDALEEQIRERLLDHMASVTLQADLEIAEWVSRAVLALDADGRAALWRHVSWLLRDMPPEAVEQRWNDWMEPHWRARLQSVPVSLSIDEVSAMATWVPRLGKAADTAMDLTLQHDAGLEQHSDLLRDLASSELLVADRDKSARFVAHLLKGTDAPFYACRDLSTIIRRLRATSAEPKAVMEQALRLGCPPVIWEHDQPG